MLSLFPYNFYFSYLNVSSGKEDICVVHFYIHYTALPKLNTNIIKMCEWVSASLLEVCHLGIDC